MAEERKRPVGTRLTGSLTLSSRLGVAISGPISSVAPIFRTPDRTRQG